MTDRAQALMNAIWEARNSGVDTEEQLVSEILKIVAENVRSYTAQNNLIVLDRNDILKLAEELNQ